MRRPLSNNLRFRDNGALRTLSTRRGRSAYTRRASGLARPDRRYDHNTAIFTY